MSHHIWCFSCPTILGHLSFNILQKQPAHFSRLPTALFRLKFNRFWGRGKGNLIHANGRYFLFLIYHANTHNKKTTSDMPQPPSSLYFCSVASSEKESARGHNIETATCTYSIILVDHRFFQTHLRKLMCMLIVVLLLLILVP